MKLKVLGIAPYLGMKTLMDTLAAGDADIDIDVYHGNLQDGLKLCKSAEEKGYDIIISRGGTASLIRKHVRLPVVDIQVSGYDLLRVLTLVKDYQGKVAILGFPNITHGASAICDLMNIDIKTFTINNAYEVENTLNIIRKQGFDVVIGDVITVETAQNLGLQEILLTSGRESILESFEEAKEIFRAFNPFRTNEFMYKKALDLSVRGVVIINHNRQIVFYNDVAKSYIQDLEPWTEPQLVNILGRLVNEKSVQDLFINLNDQLFTVSGNTYEYRHDMYFTLYFDKISEAFNAQNSGVKILQTFSNESAGSYTRLTGSSPAVQSVLEKAKHISAVDAPYWIYGESGTGKSHVVQMIHQTGKRRNHQLILLDAKLINKNKWESLLYGSHDSRGLLDLLKSGTLYLKNINALPNDIAEKLSFHLQNQEDDQPIIVAASQEKPETLLAKGKIPHGLFYYLTKNTLCLPTLEERKEDIPDLTKLFIANYNSRYGKQVVGLEPVLQTELINREWPGNIAQLQHVIEQFILATQGPFVKLAEVKDILTTMDQTDHQSIEKTLPLDGTLEEIEKNIIQAVLDEEDGNQSKAAKRLGINRTTLWRKLK